MEPTTGSMLMRRLMTLAVLAAFAGTQAFAAGPKLTAENTKIEFTGTKKDGSHTGGCKQVTGTVELPGDDLSQAVIRGEIVTDSTYTEPNHTPTYDSAQHCEPGGDCTCG